MQDVVSAITRLGGFATALFLATLLLIDVRRQLYGEIPYETLAPGGAAVRAVATSKQGQWIAAADGGVELQQAPRNIYTWKRSSPHLRRTYALSSGTLDIEFSQSGDMLTYADGGSVVVLTVSSGNMELIPALVSASSPIWAQDDRFLVFYDKAMLRVYDHRQHRVVSSLRSGSGFEWDVLGVSNDGTYIVAVEHHVFFQKTARIRVVPISRTGSLLLDQELVINGGRDRIIAVQCHPERRSIFVAQLGGVVREICISTGKAMCDISADSDSIFSIAVFDDGNRIAVGGAGGVSIWNMRTGNCTRKFVLPGKIVRSLAISAEQDMVYSACSDSRIRIWKVAFPFMRTIVSSLLACMIFSIVVAGCPK